MKQRIAFIALLAAALLASCSRPVAQFSVSGPQQALRKLKFDNQSEKAIQYEWDFGDGQTSVEPSPSHKYRRPGTYTVALSAINEKGKAKTATQQLTIDPPKECLIEIQTAHGNMIAKLYDTTPQHQDNFLKLLEDAFYDSLLFHRVIPNFMIQGGDPTSKGAADGQSLGSGGPGYTVPAEFVDSLVHVKGAIAAARTGDQVNPEKRSSGSQFYIVHGQELSEEILNRIEAQKNTRYTTEQRAAYLKYGGAPFLDRDYTVFGQVIEGLDVLDKLATVPTDGRDRPKEDLMMRIRLVQ